MGLCRPRDVAQACRLAIEADTTGAEVFIIAAADTVMDRASKDLAAEHFPRVPFRETSDEHATLLAIDKARRMLGYHPAYSWRRRG